MQLRQKYEQLQDAGVEVVALAPDEPAVLANLARILKLPYQLVGDPQRTVYEQYNLVDGKKIYGANYVLDGQGVIRYAYRGVTPEDRPPLKELVEAGRAAGVSNGN